jgi:hypothetical protein
MAAWDNDFREKNQEMMKRALRLGARLSTVIPLFGGKPIKTIAERMCNQINAPRVSGQIPSRHAALLSPQMRLHLTIFKQLFDLTPKQMPPAWRIIEAYEGYARMVVRVDEDGNILDGGGVPVSLGGANRDHPALPKLLFDRAADFAMKNFLGLSSPYSMGYCWECHTPAILETAKRSASHRCAVCTDRLNAGRRRDREPEAAEPATA